MFWNFGGFSAPSVITIAIKGYSNFYLIFLKQIQCAAYTFFQAELDPQTQEHNLALMLFGSRKAQK